jgi:uncharacterized protein (TIGR03545 family)
MRIFRPTGIIIVLILAALLWGLGYFWINHWLATVLEQEGSQLNGATVTADRISINWFNSGLDIAHLALADPENLSHNRLQLDQLKFDLSLTALLKGQFHVDELKVDTLRVNVPRTTPAQRVVRDASKTTDWQWPKAVMEKTQDLNAKDLLARAQIKSPQLYDNFLMDIEKKKQTWQQSFNQLPNEQVIAELKQDYKKAKQNLDQAKGLEKIAATKNLKKVIDRAKKEKEKVSQFRHQLREGIDSLKQQWSELKQQVNQDVQLAMSMASLSPEGMRHMAASLLGESAAHWIGLVIDNLDTVKKLAVNTDKPQEQVPLRKGIDIPLVQAQLPPDFWIKKAQLSGMFQFNEQQGSVEGNILNLASELIPNAPTEGEISLTLGEATTAATGRLQFAVQHPEAQNEMVAAQLQLNRWPMTDWVLADGGLTLTQPVANVELTTSANQVQTRLDMNLQLVDFKIKKGETSKLKWVSQLSELMQDSQQIELSIHFEQQAGQTSLSLTSNLDTLFFAKIKDEFKQRADGVKADVEQSLQQKLEPVRQKIEQQLGSIADLEQTLKARLDSLDGLK